MEKISNVHKDKQCLKEKWFFRLSIGGYIVAFVLFLCACYKWVFVFVCVGAFFSLIIKTEVPENMCFPKETLTDDEIEELKKIIEEMK